MAAAEWAGIVGLAALSTAFLILLFKGLFTAWRAQEEEFAKSPRSEGRSLRRLYLTRVLPFVLVLILVQVGGAFVGVVTGHGAMASFVVATLSLMGAAVLGIVVVVLVSGARAARIGAKVNEPAR